MHSKHSDLSPKGCRALGIDFGTKRIGMAVSDSTNTLAAPLKTLIRREGKRPPYARMLETATDYDVCQLVVGLPLAIDGSEPEFAGYAREFGRQLQCRFELPVNFVDETLTTDFADSIIRETTTFGKRITKRRQSVRDRLAAELILKSYLHECTTSQAG